MLRKLSIWMFLCVQDFKSCKNARLSFKFGMCVCYWILRRQYARVFDWKPLSHKFWCFTNNFRPLGKRKAKSLIGMVVVTCNIYTIGASDLPHPAHAQFFVWNKQHLCPLENREVQSLLGWLLWLSIYTQSMRERSN